VIHFVFLHDGMIPLSRQRDDVRHETSLSTPDGFTVFEKKIMRRNEHAKNQPSSNRRIVVGVLIFVTLLVAFQLALRHLFLGGKQLQRSRENTTGARPPDLGKSPGVAHDSAGCSHTVNNPL
jgi:hypothetical protein